MLVSSLRLFIQAIPTNSSIVRLLITYCSLIIPKSNKKHESARTGSIWLFFFFVKLHGLSRHLLLPTKRNKPQLIDFSFLTTGAAIAGSAVDQVEQVVGYVSLGYPFGFTASILFGRHQKTILQSPKPKLFVMGTKDGFTSVKQLENKLKDAAGHNTTHLIEGASHFQMEGPAFDADMVNLILEFIPTL